MSTRDLPIACTLGPDDGSARLSRWAAICEPPPSAVRRSGTLEVTFGPGVRDELRALAGAEQECCAFATWTVTEHGRRSVLTVTAEEPAALDPIAALFGV